MHSSLLPKTNMLLLAMWSALAAAVAALVSPTPWSFLAMGLVQGVCAGVLQLRALRESTASYLTTRTAMDVRRVLSSSRSGQLYLNIFWICMAVQFALAFYFLRGGVFIGLIASYSAFAFARELITLRGTFELHRLAMKRGA
jgi:hypothetical protein